MELFQPLWNYFTICWSPSISCVLGTFMNRQTGFLWGLLCSQWLLFFIWRPLNIKLCSLHPLNTPALEDMLTILSGLGTWTFQVAWFCEHFWMGSIKTLNSPWNRSGKDVCPLGVLVCRKNDGSLCRKVYRKPTHTNLYLNNNSHPHLTQKRYRAKMISDPMHL